jgi:hypothetical protein
MPRPSVLVQNSFINAKMKNLFKDEEDCESHQFVNPPVPV